MTTHHYTVEGPVSLFLTTTALEVDEELGNRCLVLSVDESRQQTKAIHRQQLSGQTCDGIAAGMAGEILGRSLDELSPQTRTFLERLHEFVIQSCQQQDLHRGEFRFTRRDIRQSLSWSD